MLLTSNSDLQECGQYLADDFYEMKPGAALKLERALRMTAVYHPSGSQDQTTSDREIGKHENVADAISPFAITVAKTQNTLPPNPLPS